MKHVSRATPVFNFSSSTCARTSNSRPLVVHQTTSSTQCNQQQRNVSSYRRQRKVLNIPPAPSFGGSPIPTGSSGRSRTALEPRPPGDHIIFNPPSSAPNVYHTPSKFLPETDPRRKLLEADAKAPHSQLQTPAAPVSPTAFPMPLAPSLLATASAPRITHSANFAHTWPATHKLPPPVRTPYEKKYHLTPEQIEEMRALRQSDENKWTRQRLADKFGCTQFFVGLVVQASEERKRRLREQEAKYAYHWRARGGVSLKTRKERQKRRALWMAEA